jgi:DNA-binding CsgD family transcriptional regulator
MQVIEGAYKRFYLLLSERQREAVDCAMNGWSQYRIAAYMRIARSTVRNHLQRARKKFNAQ